MRGYGYYVGNIIVCLLYLWLRQHLPNVFSPKYARVEHVEEVFGWEGQIAVTWIAIVGVKAFRSRSNEAIVASVFYYTKAVVFVLLFTADTRLCALYLLLCYVVFLLFPMPFYDDTAKLVFLTPENFLETVMSPAAEATWLVEFYGPSNLVCAQFSSSMAALADKYSSEYLKFGKLDVTTWPHVAQKLSIEPQSQLPTLILFENGKEHSRLPRLNQGRSEFTKANAVAFFELDWRHTSIPATSTNTRNN